MNKKTEATGILVREQIVCTQEVEVSIAVFNRHKRLLCSKMNLKSKNRLAISFVWSIADTRTLKKDYQSRLKDMEMEVDGKY